MNEIHKIHECDVLKRTKVKLTIEKINGDWLWVYWNEKEGNTAHGIRYCPYCGEELSK